MLVYEYKQIILKMLIIIMKLRNTIIYTVILILMIDFACFLAWSTSGQMPVDNFHAGIISESIIKLIK